MGSRSLNEKKIVHYLDLLIRETQCIQQGSNCHVMQKILKVLFRRVTVYDLNNLWEQGGQYALGTYTCVLEAFEHVIGEEASHL